MSKFVRLLPKGFHKNVTIEGYVYKSKHYIGGKRPVWYLVDDAFADELSVLKQNESDWDSPPLFQIMDKETKERIEHEEEVRHLARLGIPRSISELPQTFRNAPTKDFRSAEMKAAEDAGGRSAAIPPTRALTSDETNAAAIAMAAASKSNKVVPLLPALSNAPAMYPAIYPESESEASELIVDNKASEIDTEELQEDTGVLTTAKIPGAQRGKIRRRGN